MISCKSRQSACHAHLAHIRPIKFATFGDKRRHTMALPKGSRKGGRAKGGGRQQELKPEPEPEPADGKWLRCWRSGVASRSEGVIKILLCTLQYQRQRWRQRAAKGNGGPTIAVLNPRRKCVTCECDCDVRAKGATISRMGRERGGITNGKW